MNLPKQTDPTSKNHSESTSSTSSSFTTVIPTPSTPDSKEPIETPPISTTGTAPTYGNCKNRIMPLIIKALAKEENKEEVRELSQALLVEFKNPDSVVSCVMNDLSDTDRNRLLNSEHFDPFLKLYFSDEDSFRKKLKENSSITIAIIYQLSKVRVAEVPDLLARMTESDKDAHTARTMHEVFSKHYPAELLHSLTVKLVACYQEPKNPTSLKCFNLLIAESGQHINLFGFQLPHIQLSELHTPGINLMRAVIGQSLYNYSCPDSDFREATIQTKRVCGGNFQRCNWSNITFPRVSGLIDINNFSIQRVDLLGIKIDEKGKEFLKNVLRLSFIAATKFSSSEHPTNRDHYVPWEIFSPINSRIKYLDNTRPEGDFWSRFSSPMTHRLTWDDLVHLSRSYNATDATSFQGYQALFPDALKSNLGFKKDCAEVTANFTAWSADPDKLLKKTEDHRTELKR